MLEDVRLKESFTGRYLAKISKISIIIPIYNESRTIEKCKDSFCLFLENVRFYLWTGEAQTIHWRKFLLDPDYTVRKRPGLADE